MTLRHTPGRLGPGTGLVGTARLVEVDDDRDVDEHDVVVAGRAGLVAAPRLRGVPPRFLGLGGPAAGTRRDEARRRSLNAAEVVHPTTVPSRRGRSPAIGSWGR